MNDLTPTQKKILEFLQQANSNSIPPTIREICAATGIKSTSSVHSNLCVLEEKGHIVRESGATRSIRLADTAKAVNVPLAVELSFERNNLKVVRSVASIPFPVDYSHGSSELFAVRVDNDSLETDGILDGDIAICCFSTQAKQGELTVTLLDKTPTVTIFKNDFSSVIIGKVIACIRFYG